MNPGEYRAHDLALCAFLCLEDFQILRIEQVADTRAEMVFGDGDELRHAVQMYHTDRARVEPRAFKRAHDEARGRLMDCVSGR